MDIGLALPWRELDLIASTNTASLKWENQPSEEPDNQLFFFATTLDFGPLRTTYGNSLQRPPEPLDDCSFAERPHSPARRQGGHSLRRLDAHLLILTLRAIPDDEFHELCELHRIRAINRIQHPPSALPQIFGIATITRIEHQPQIRHAASSVNCYAL
ncbi:hypothetical protein [Burkholderia pseudomallei]|uniref:hypothetical protein n=1 Tax=Burkholderia pseudomallei TaxID=28450 RepID=UPI0011C4C21A|nr:hypothetical protein [Burkholderia pseudomallei]